MLWEDRGRPLTSSGATRISRELAGSTPTCADYLHCSPSYESTKRVRVKALTGRGQVPITCRLLKQTSPPLELSPVGRLTQSGVVATS